MLTLKHIKDQGYGKVLIEYTCTIGELKNITILSLDNSAFPQNAYNYTNRVFNKNEVLAKYNAYKNIRIVLAYLEDVVGNSSNKIDLHAKSTLLISDVFEYSALLNKFPETEEVSIEVLVGYDMLEIAEQFVFLHGETASYIKSDFNSVFGFIQEKISSMHIAKCLSDDIIKKLPRSHIGNYKKLLLNSLDKFINKNYFAIVKELSKEFHNVLMEVVYGYIREQSSYKSILSDTLYYFEEIDKLNLLDSDTNVKIAVELLETIAADINVKEFFSRMKSDNNTRAFVSIFNIQDKGTREAELLNIMDDKPNVLVYNYIKTLKRGTVITFSDVLGKLAGQFNKFYPNSTFIETKVLSAINNNIKYGYLTVKKAGEYIVSI